MGKICQQSNPTTHIYIYNIYNVLLPPAPSCCCYSHIYSSPQYNPVRGPGTGSQEQISLRRPFLGCADTADPYIPTPLFSGADFPRTFVSTSPYHCTWYILYIRSHPCLTGKNSLETVPPHLASFHLPRQHGSRPSFNTNRFTLLSIAGMAAFSTINGILYSASYTNSPFLCRLFQFST